jgi:hypothetical protein
VPSDEAEISILLLLFEDELSKLKGLIACTVFVCPDRVMRGERLVEDRTEASHTQMPNPPLLPAHAKCTLPLPPPPPSELVS